MAQYKVPQDVEAEDKLLGPFTFRQFIYLMIIGGLIGVGVLFWQIFPPLIIVLVPPILLLGALALPLKKDQPMETYLSAVVSFYLKPHTRIWEPGEPESTIVITAPKQTEEKRTKDIDQEEAMHRLSFLADIIDTEGYAIKGATPNSAVREDVYAEANDTLDMFDDPTASNNSIGQTLQNDASTRRNDAISQMRAAIENSSRMNAENATINHNGQQIQPAYQNPQQPQGPQPAPAAPQTQTATPTQEVASQYQPAPSVMPEPPALPENPVAENVVAATHEPEAITTEEDPLSDDAVKANDAIIKPDSMVEEMEAEEAEKAAEEAKKRKAEEEEKKKAEAEAKAAEEKAEPEEPDPGLLDLANNNDFSIETIAKQAKRIKEKKDDEVYISLH